jgi:uncharacterized protein YgiM (DUF1202 family)
MAHCFRCGSYLDPKQDQHRRRVYTGSSSGSWWSRRSSGTSIRRYRGYRTLCALCATRHDRFQRIKWVSFGIVVVLVIIVGVLQPPAGGTRRTGNTTSQSTRRTGVPRRIRVAVDSANVRETAAQSARVVSLVRRGEELVVLSETNGWYRVAQSQSPDLAVGFVNRSVVETR